MLFNVVAIIVLGIIDVVLGTFSEDAGLGLLSCLYLLAVLLPSLTVPVRRLHDTDRSGWWTLINSMPLIGGIVLLVFTLLDSAPGSNRFGPSPKGEATGGLARNVSHAQAASRGTADP